MYYLKQNKLKPNQLNKIINNIAYYENTTSFDIERLYKEYSADFNLIHITSFLNLLARHKNIYLKSGYQKHEQLRNMIDNLVKSIYQLMLLGETKKMSLELISKILNSLYWLGLSSMLYSNSFAVGPTESVYYSTVIRYLAIQSWLLLRQDKKGTMVARIKILNILSQLYILPSNLLLQCEQLTQQRAQINSVTFGDLVCLLIKGNFAVKETITAPMIIMICNFINSIAHFIARYYIIKNIQSAKTLLGYIKSLQPIIISNLKNIRMEDKVSILWTYLLLKLCNYHEFDIFFQKINNELMTDLKFLSSNRNIFNNHTLKQLKQLSVFFPSLQSFFKSFDFKKMLKRGEGNSACENKIWQLLTSNMMEVKNLYFLKSYYEKKCGHLIDIVCFSKCNEKIKIAIEIDGGHHYFYGTQISTEKTLLRNLLLEKCGWNVCTFSVNPESNLNNVVHDIIESLQKSVLA